MLETYFIQFGPVFITAKPINSESSLILFTMRADVTLMAPFIEFSPAKSDARIK